VSVGIYIAQAISKAATPFSKNYVLERTLDICPNFMRVQVLMTVLVLLYHLLAFKCVTSEHIAFVIHTLVIQARLTILTMAFTI